MPRRRLTMRSIFVNGGALALMLFSSACSSSNKKGLPTNLPNIALNSSAATPAHTMASYDYPFDSSGNYVTSWAAEGERRSGRSAASYSNPGSSPRRTSSSSRSRYTSSTRPKTTTTTKKPSSSSSGSARVHKVKSGDTLYGLARRYGTTVAKIKAANGLRSDNIGVGRSLKIPR